MESVHGVDVSWISKHPSATSKDHATRKPVGRKSSSPPLEKEPRTVQNRIEQEKETLKEPATLPRPIPISRPSYGRSPSSEKTPTLNANTKSGTPSPGSSRRNSWLSSISSKFSSSPGTHNAHNSHAPSSTPPKPATPPSSGPITPPGQPDPKSTIPPHAQKINGDVAYASAPPKTTQPSFLQSALRRLSSSGGQSMSSVSKGHHSQHGVCQRRVLNVDHNRERCTISSLDQSKLRRVAFCVDVEIASGPHYIDDDVEDRKEKKESRKIKDKGEGLALRNPEPIVDGKETSGVARAGEEELSSSPEKEALVTRQDSKEDHASGEKDTKKKEKKKRSEEERKARKEKQRRLAEQNGTLPVELTKNASDLSIATSGGIPKAQVTPTTDPVRIYRRCCQLRETPILKKITEQLGAVDNQGPGTGVVLKLDLTGYWLQLPDLITLGDYLAVVPVKELIMENCGLTDEGVRVVLAGLLAAKCPDWVQRGFTRQKDGEVPQGGFVERVVFKNNPRLGKEGWIYIATFIAMCRSLKAMDLSKVPFPQSDTTTSSASTASLSRTLTSSSTASTTVNMDMASIFSQAIGFRLGGDEFELLIMAETGLTTDQLGTLIDGVVRSGLRRLGIAGNGISAEGMQHVARYIRDGKCEGLDLGGNDLNDQLNVVAEALDDGNALYALSLADCNLTPESLRSLFPALAKLNNFRFIDLSQNHGLFDTDPSALSLLRRYLPKMPHLKRIHLIDVSMTPEQAIALAEILPESPNLAHVNIMDNIRLSALATAKDEANQEEACALYASLMAAVRVSRTIICVDIEVPAADSSEIVKALAKQVVAYCLRNMERGPVAEISEAAAAISEPHGGEKEVAVPDVLLHLVGHIEGFHENHDEDEPAPDEDYVIGGTGVVKALGICLRNGAADSRRPSSDRAFSNISEPGGSGSGTPRAHVSGGKAKDMSKNLLGSARKIRARLQPALVKESRNPDRTNYHRLLFLNQTLEGMIKRFEDEYPETRLLSGPTSPPLTDNPPATRSRANTASSGIVLGSDTEQAPLEEPLSDTEDAHVRPMLSRHNSDVSIASRALAHEEGRMHRFGQQVRRDILKPETEDKLHGMTGHEAQPKHVEMLRAWVEELGGEEIKAKVLDEGAEAVIGELNDEASALRQRLMEQDPEGWEIFVQSQEAAMRNLRLEMEVKGGAGAVGGSAVEE